MKSSIFQTIFFVAFIAFLFTSCKRVAPIDPNGLEQGTLTAKIDGVKFKSKFASAYIIESFGGIQFFHIAGYDIPSSLGLSLYLPDGSNLEEIAYQFDDEDCDPDIDICGLIEFTGANTSEYAVSDFANGSTQITFTSIDYRIGGSCKGTFSGVLTDDDQNVINVTDGKFNLKIEEE